MHPVPPLADLDWLLGDRLDVVSTAEFTIWFSFDSKGVVQADDMVELVGGDGKSEFYNPQTREDPWPFLKLIGRTVANVARPDDWTIEITFEGDFRLVTRSSDGGSESGQITVPGRDAQSSQFF